MRRTDFDSQCITTDECTPGSYCETGKTPRVCTKGLSNYAACTSDEQCLGGAFCHTYADKTSKCIPFYSLSPNSYVKSCASKGYNYPGCKSGICFASNQDDGVCIDKVAVVNDKPCARGNECLTNADPLVGSPLYTSCRCSGNSEGQAFCDRAPGNAEVDDYMNYVTQWASSDDIFGCSSSDKF